MSNNYDDRYAPRGFGQKRVISPGGSRFSSRSGDGNSANYDTGRNDPWSRNKTPYRNSYAQMKARGRGMQTSRTTPDQRRAADAYQKVIQAEEQLAQAKRDLTKAERWQ